MARRIRRRVPPARPAHMQALLEPLVRRRLQALPEPLVRHRLRALRRVVRLAQPVRRQGLLPRQGAGPAVRAVRLQAAVAAAPAALRARAAAVVVAAAARQGEAARRLLRR